MKIFELGGTAATTPPVTTPPETVPPTTTVPVTTLPVTSPPSTEPPATEPPATESPATEPPVSGGPSNIITYIGCFADSKDGRVFTGEQFTSPDMTSEVREIVFRVDMCRLEPDRLNAGASQAWPLSVPYRPPACLLSKR